METLNIKISKFAKRFIRQKGIEDVTFNLFEAEVAGCCVGVVKEIIPEHKAPADASGYRYCRVEDFHRLGTSYPITYDALLLGSFQVKIWKFLLELIHEIFKG